MRWPLLVLLTLATAAARSQVIISLLLGDKLNSGKIEFGLEGGATLSTLSGTPGADPKTGFNLGFYFDIKTRGDWRIATGVMVKSPWGARDLAPYALGDSALDALFGDGHVDRELRYFNVPIMLKRSFGDFFATGGVQLSLGYKAFDVFKQEVKDADDLTYRRENRELYNPVDVGVVASVGYRLMKGHGVNLLIRYYQGLRDIRKEPVGDAQYNSGWHLLVGIPIGVGKAQERMKEKASE